VKVVVTGGAGFIGSALVERLVGDGHDVDVFDDLSTGDARNLEVARRLGGDRLRLHRLDVRSSDTVAEVVRLGPELVYHLAAQADVRVSVERPAFDAEVNVVGSLHVCEGALAAGARKVVFAGSGGTLYGVPDVIPTPEDHPRRPVSPYGVAKKAVGDYLHYYREVRGLDFTVLALANVYGPRQDPHGEAGVVAIFAGRLLAGETPLIFGDGHQTRDFVLVDDVADAFVLAGGAGGGELLTVGPGRETSVRELFSAMARLTGFGGEPEFAPARPGELQRSALDPSRALAVLGWRPRSTLEEGLERTLAWFRPGDR
jgi:UDP-glucose 4-epimerase